MVEAVHAGVDVQGSPLIFFGGLDCLSQFFEHWVVADPPGLGGEKVTGFQFGQCCALLVRQLTAIPRLEHYPAGTIG